MNTKSITQHFAAGHAPCSEAAHDAAQEERERLHEEVEAHAHQAAWVALREAGEDAVFTAFETLAIALRDNKKVVASACEMVSIAANSGELNEVDARRVFGLLQRLLRDVAQQWARDELGVAP